MVEKIPHLLSLGINCVELLPVFEFSELACAFRDPVTKQPLMNYWGYSPESFFVPMHRYATEGVPCLQLDLVNWAGQLGGLLLLVGAVDGE